jgi:hypothetical protein
MPHTVRALNVGICRFRVVQGDRLAVSSTSHEGDSAHRTSRALGRPSVRLRIVDASRRVRHRSLLPRRIEHAYGRIVPVRTVLTVLTVALGVLLLTGCSSGRITGVPTVASSSVVTAPIRSPADICLVEGVAGADRFASAPGAPTGQLIAPLDLTTVPNMLQIWVDGAAAVSSAVPGSTDALDDSRISVQQNCQRYGYPTLNATDFADLERVASAADRAELMKIDPTYVLGS